MLIRFTLPGRLLARGALAALALILAASPGLADEAGRAELERARGSGAGPAELIRILDTLIQDETETPQQRGQWRLERDRQQAELVRVRAGEIALRAEAGAAPETVLEPLREALASVRELSRGRWADPHRDETLVRRLERQINWVELRPAVEKIDRTLGQARAATGPEAEELFLEARRLQLDLNRRFPRAAQASQARLKLIDDELAALRRGDREASLARLLDAAEIEAREGRPEEQERLLAEAARLRGRLDADLAPAEVAPRREALRKRMQVIRALPRVALVASLEAEAAAFLRSGDTEAASARLAAAMAELTAAAEQFPDGVELEPGLRDRLAYLAPRRARLGDLQRDFSRTLVPLPGRPGLLMMKIEMPQSLHERVAGLNPSRVTGVNRPVESVNWWDAMAVAERLGWIMGAEVRLPTQAEWTSAVANDDQAGWLAENSEGLIRDTGLLAASKAGFHDLVGNVGEWLLPEAGRPSPMAGVAGGSVADALAAVLAEPVRQLNGLRRDRLVGYRLVMVRP
jgi:hypothetical protein